MGAGAWTVLKADRKRIDTFEDWCCRRVFEGPAVGKKVTNMKIIKTILPGARVQSGMIAKFRLSYIGHVFRKPTSMENCHTRFFM